MANFVMALDVSEEILRKHNYNHSVNNCEKFLKKIIYLSLNEVHFFKLQIAFFEQFGWKGIKLMEEVILLLKKKGKFIILDTKRNDIHNTMLAYYKAYLDLYDVDAVTISPYFGLLNFKESLTLFKKKKKQAFIISVPSTSLQEEKGVFSAFLEDEPVFEKINDIVGKYNSDNHTNMGVVIGNHNYLPKSSFNGDILIPGCFTQGNDINELKNKMGKLFDKAYIISGRYILSDLTQAHRKILEIKKILN